MTCVNKLILSGFKSFAKRTEIDFEGGFNVVLGPNGSGKSNIIDALTFVLGRMSSKSLRAEKFSHLIYNGGKTKQPANKAEVSIVFDNKDKEFPIDSTTIKISRIVNQKGQSIYRINEEKKSRTEVLEIMSFAKIDPNGHNVILQGDIIKFVDMSPENRRELIEEVAGISIYEDKKKKALKELEKVGTKLKEADILLSERRARLKELRKDRDHALKYKDVEINLRRNKATQINLQIKNFDDKKKHLNKELEGINTEIEKFRIEIEGLKSKVEERKEQVKNISGEIDEKGKTDEIELNKTIEMLRVDLASNSNRISTIDQEIERIKERKEQLGEEILKIGEKTKDFEIQKKELLEKKAIKDSELKKINSEIEIIRKKSGSEDIDKLNFSIEEIEKEEEKLQIQHKNITQERQNLIRDNDQKEFLISNLVASIEKIESLKEEHSNELKEIAKKKTEYKKILVQLNKILSEDNVNSSKLSDSRNRLYSVSKEVIELRNKALQASESATGNQSVKEVLRNKNFGGVYGTVAQLGKVKDKFTVALETCAGPRMNSIVTDSDGTASKCIKFLRDKKLGSASFLPLNKLKSVSSDIKNYNNKKGALGMALDLINFESKYKSAFMHVFGTTLVVDNIDNARKIGVGTIRMVTLDGDLIEKSGAMMGGYRKRKGKGFSEEKLSTELAKKEEYESDLENLVSSFEKKKEKISEEIATLRNKKGEMEGEIIKAEKSLHLDSSDLDSSFEKKKTIEKEISLIGKSLLVVDKKEQNLNKSLNSLKDKKLNLKQKIGNLQNPRLIAEMNTFTQQRQIIVDEASTLNSEINKLEITINQVLNADTKRTQSILKQSDKDVKTFSLEKTELLNKNKKNSKQLKEKEAESKKFKKQFSALFDKKQKLSEEIQKFDEKIIRREEQINACDIKINNITLKNSDVMASLAGLNEEFKQYSDVKLLVSLSMDDIKLNIRKYQQSLSSLGNVNMKALEIYEEVERSYNELVEKKNLLISEKEEVSKLMEEIEEKKQELFMEAFKNLGQKFSKAFSEISLKGDAYLVLENEKKPFEGGIRIRVRLSGNKFMDIRSLSGGEKSMTALAFIFAIQEYEPASFYILDEVDAALDKKNSEKLSNLIKKYSDKAQYIVISHNDNVLSEADTLYGISMNEHGISNIASLKI